MNIKHTYSGKSILELKKEFGLGSKGFYDQSWYENEDLAKEKPQAGEYEICFDKDSVNKTYSEQIAGLQEGFTVPHPTIVIEAILTHFKKTGERLLEDWYVRTSSLDSDGRRVDVGFCPGGLYVYHWHGSNRVSSIGVSSSKKVNSCDVMSVYAIPEIIEFNGFKYKKI